MAYNDHWAVQDTGKFALDPDDYRSQERILERFVRLNATQREQSLREVWGIAANPYDGSTLRQRAQIFNINRKLTDAHKALLRAGR